MDLNQLLFAHQLAVMQTGACRDGASEQSRSDAIALLAEQLRQLRGHHPRAEVMLRGMEQETLIYATYAGPPHPDPDDDQLRSWESEGGARRFLRG